MSAARARRRAFVRSDRLRDLVVAYADDQKNIVARNTYGPFGEQGANNIGVQVAAFTS